MQLPFLSLMELRGIAVPQNYPRHSDDYGPPPPWPEMEVGTAAEFFLGIQAALVLAGYTTTLLRIEDASGDSYEIDLATNRGGSVPASADGLEPVRTTSYGFMAALAVEPFRPFGGDVGPPFALPTDLLTAGPQHALFTDTDGGWLAFTTPTTAFKPALRDLFGHTLAAAAALAATILTAWYRTPDDFSTPAGLGWILDSSRWAYPPLAPSQLTGTAALVHNEWHKAHVALAAGDLDLAGYVSDQTDRKGYARWAYRKGSVDKVLSGANANVRAAVQAYRLRAEEMAGTPAERFNYAGAYLKQNLHLDAVGLLAEHGVIDILSQVPLRSDTVSSPEYTDPHLTGVWYSPTNTDVFLVNQAGSYMEGYEHRRVDAGSGIEIEYYSWDAELTSATATTSTWAMRYWPLDNEIDREESDRERLPLPDLGTITVSTDGYGGASLTRTVGGRVDSFELGYLRAHVTNRLLEASEPSLPRRDRLRWMRDMTFHPADEQIVEDLVGLVVHYVDRWVEEQPTDRDAGPLAQEFDREVVAAVGGHYVPAGEHPTGEWHGGDLLPAIRVAAASDLTRGPIPGGLTYWSLMVAILKESRTFTANLQNIFGIVLGDPTGELYYYRWRLVDTLEGGATYYAGGGARGTGTFEIQRVTRYVALGETDEPLEAAETMGPVESRDIDLATGIFGLAMPGLDTGWGDISDWQGFFAPADRDILPHLDEATLTLWAFNAGALLVSSKSNAEVVFQPSDGLEPLLGRVGQPLIEVSIPTDPKGDFDDLRDFYKALKEGAELVDKVKPEAKGVRTVGTVHDEPTEEEEEEEVPQPLALLPGDLVGATTGQALFESGQWTFTPDFLPVLRRFLAAYLPVLRNSIATLSVEGHASQLGTEEDNMELSRQRAMSVLEAIRHVLGTQLAVPNGDVRCLYFGESEASGSEGDDLPGDRRVDIRLAGNVVMML